MNPDTVYLGFLWYIAFLFSLCCHESAHALAARLGGDPTAFLAGQMTLNPVPHVRREVFGTVIVPIVSYALGGWMIGWASAPYDPRWRRLYPRRAAWMALAGPVANFSLAVLAAVAIRAGIAMRVFAFEGPFGFARLVSAVPSSGFAAHALATLLSIVFSLNVLLGAFNLLPVPPLDGNAALGLLLPESWARRLADFGQNPTLALVGLLLAWKFLDVIFQPIFSVALGLIYTR